MSKESPKVNLNFDRNCQIHFWRLNKNIKYSKKLFKFNVKCCVKIGNNMPLDKKTQLFLYKVWIKNYWFGNVNILQNVEFSKNLQFGFVRDLKSNGQNWSHNHFSDLKNKKKTKINK